MSRVTRLEYTPPDHNGQQPDTEEPHIVEIRGQQFHLAQPVPGWVVFEIGRLSADNPGESRMSIMRTATLGLIALEDHNRFINLMRTADPIIDVNEMLYYVNGIIEAASSRPTVGPQDSPPSLPDTPTPSTAGIEPAAEEANQAASPL